MEKTTLVPKSSELYRKIDALNLTPAAHDKAVGTLKLAEMLVDSAIALVRKLRRPAFGESPRNIVSTGKLKHQ